jgi:ribonuclease P protein component
MAKTFRPGEHIRRRADFEAVYQTGVRITSRWMTIFVKPNGGAQPRLGIAATRKIGGAVVRNRAKRVTRELFRACKPPAPVDIVVVPRRELVDAPFTALEHEFQSLLTRATRVAPTAGHHAFTRPRGRRGARVDSRV